MTGTIEKVYSRALFELGIENNSLDELYSELMGISDIIYNNPDLIKFLSAPVINQEEKLLLIKRIFEGKVSEHILSFLCVLTDKNRVRYLTRIAEDFKNSYNEHNGIIEVTVTTALPLKPELKEKLVKKLEEVSEKRISIVEKVDKDILGGMILSYGNTQMDSSVKSRLDNVHLKMKSIIA